MQPGAVNIIPGSCEFSVELRDQSVEVLDRLAQVFEKELSKICSVKEIRMSMRMTSDHEPGKMNQIIQRTIVDSCEKLDLSYMVLPSGAFHDSLLLTRRFLSGMIFVPSVGGISHSPKEFTREEDLAAGVDVLLNTVLMLDKKEGIRDESI